MSKDKLRSLQLLVCDIRTRLSMNFCICLGLLEHIHACTYVILLAWLHLWPLQHWLRTAYSPSKHNMNLLVTVPSQVLWELTGWLKLLIWGKVGLVLDPLANSEAYYRWNRDKLGCPPESTPNTRSVVTRQSEVTRRQDEGHQLGLHSIRAMSVKQYSANCDGQYDGDTLYQQAGYQMVLTLSGIHQIWWIVLPVRDDFPPDFLLPEVSHDLIDFLSRSVVTNHEWLLWNPS